MDRIVGVGINEYPTPNTLHQCVADINDWMLPSLRQFRPDFAQGRNVRTLLDSRATKLNIMARINWLLRYSSKGDRILFYYSGHGTNIPTDDPSEPDGKDEAIVPVDYDGSDGSLILDNVFSAFHKLSREIYVVLFFDSCFSGGMDDEMGVKGLHRPATQHLFHFHRRLLHQSRKTSGRMVVIEACAEDETAAETGHGGALSRSFWSMFRKDHELPLGKLLEKTRKSVRGQCVEWDGDEELLSLPFLDSDWRQRCATL